MKLKIQEALKKAQKALEVGRMQEAQIIYRAILNAKPNHAVASHNLGIIAVGSNHIAVALELFKAAVKSKPTVEQFWVSYLTTLIEADHIEEADKVFRLSELETLNSDMIQDCRLQLGIKLSNADRFEEAIKHLEAVGSKKAKMYILRCLYLMDDRTSFCDLLAK